MNVETDAVSFEGFDKKSDRLFARVLILFVNISLIFIGFISGSPLQCGYFKDEVTIF